MGGFKRAEADGVKLQMDRSRWREASSRHKQMVRGGKLQTGRSRWYETSSGQKQMGLSFKRTESYGVNFKRTEADVYTSGGGEQR